jgi:hypothetical protein
LHRFYPVIVQPLLVNIALSPAVKPAAPVAPVMFIVLPAVAAVAAMSLNNVTNAAVLRLVYDTFICGDVPAKVEAVFVNLNELKSTLVVDELPFKANLDIRNGILKLSNLKQLKKAVFASIWFVLVDANPLKFNVFKLLQPENVELMLVIPVPLPAGITMLVIAEQF